MQSWRLVQGAGSRSRVSNPVETEQALAGLLLAARVPAVGQKLGGSWVEAGWEAATSHATQAWSIAGMVTISAD